MARHSGGLAAAADRCIDTADQLGRVLTMASVRRLSLPLRRPSPPDLPPSMAVFPAYPYGIPLFIYVASLLSRRYAEAAGGILNVLLLTTAAAILVGVVEQVRRERWPECSAALSPTAVAGLLGIGIPAVTILGPSFDASFVLTSLSDAGTSAEVAAAGVLGWLMLDRLALGQTAAARGLAIQFGFVGILLLVLRQSNPVLLAFLLAAFGAIVLRDPRLRPGDAVKLLPFLLGPGLMVFLVWRSYTAAFLPGGEVPMRDLDHWSFDLTLEILAAMGRQMMVHLPYFALMFVLTTLGLIGFWRMRDGVDRLLSIIGMMWLGYNGFLFTAYLAVFQRWEAESAAEYWRYSTHIGLLGLAGAAAVAARWWPSRRAAMAAHAAGLTALAAFPIGAAMAAEKISPVAGSYAPPRRMIGMELAETLPDGARIAVIEPRTDAMLYFVVRYQIWRPGRDDRGLRAVKEIHDPGNRSGGGSALCRTELRQSGSYPYPDRRSDSALCRSTWNPASPWKGLPAQPAG